MYARSISCLLTCKLIHCCFYNDEMGFVKEEHDDDKFIIKRGLALGGINMKCIIS